MINNMGANNSCSNSSVYSEEEYLDYNPYSKLRFSKRLMEKNIMDLRV